MYRKFEKRLIALRKEQGEQLESEVGDILIGEQLNEVQFSLGATQIEQIGLFNVLENDLLGPGFRMKKASRVAIRDFVNKQREKEVEAWRDLEKKILDLFSVEERKEFEDLLGEVPDFIPSFVGLVWR